MPSTSTKSQIPNPNPNPQIPNPNSRAGPDILLNAVPGILGNRGDAVVVFVGEGPMKEQLEGLSVSGFGVRVLTSGLHTSSSKVPGFGFGSLGVVV